MLQVEGLHYFELRGSVGEQIVNRIGSIVNMPT